MLKKIIKYGMYVFVFLLPWQTRLILRAGSLNGGYFEYGTLSLYGVDFLLLGLIVLFGVYKLDLVCEKHQVFSFGHGANPTPPFAEATEGKPPATRRPSPMRGRVGNTRSLLNSFCMVKSGLAKSIWFWILLFDLILFISIFRSNDILVAIQRYFWFLLGVGLFWLLTQAEFHREKLVRFFLAGALVQALLGIFQFTFQRTWEGKWLGLSTHNPAVSGVAVVEALGRWLRSYAGFDHPNVLGGFLAVAIALFLIAIFNSSTGKNKILRLIIYISFLNILVCALFFSFSRAAWLSFGVGFIFLGVIALVKKDKERLKKIVIGFLLLFSMILPLIASCSDLVFTRLGGGSRLEVKSLAERKESLVEVGQVLKSNWLWGVGLGNYEKYLADYQPEKTPSYVFQPVHNLYLLILAETGILGLLIFLVIISLFIFRPFFRWRSSETSDFDHVALLLVVLVLGLFDHWLWSLHFGGLFFWFICGMANKRCLSSQMP